MANPLGFLKKAVQAGALLLEDKLERLLDPAGDGVMRQALRKARDYGAELALSNVRLLEENDELHEEIASLQKHLAEHQEDLDFSAPHLYSDEVTAIKWASKGCDPETRGALDRLLLRFKHLNVTEQQLRASLHKAIHGGVTNDVYVYGLTDHLPGHTR